jgi:hypothetical protein
MSGVRGGGGADIIGSTGHTSHLLRLHFVTINRL